jgi:hypothetical protein
MTQWQPENGKWRQAAAAGENLLPENTGMQAYQRFSSSESESIEAAAICQRNEMKKKASGGISGSGVKAAKTS